jgi:uncharacterized protein YdhG (YjbR/CyaY superfamily)
LIRFATIELQPNQPLRTPRCHNRRMTKPKLTGASDVDTYLADAPEPQRSTLQSLRETLRKILPDATEAISYGIPVFTVDGRAVAGYAATATHCSYYPHSGSVLTELAADLQDYGGTKGALHFPSDRQLPEGLVRKLVKAKLGMM